MTLWFLFFFNFFSSFFLIHPFLHKYPLSSSPLSAFLRSCIFSSVTFLHFPSRTHIFKEPTLSNFSSILLPANWKALRVNFSQFHPRPTPLSLCPKPNWNWSYMDASEDSSSWPDGVRKFKFDVRVRSVMVWWRSLSISRCCYNFLCMPLLCLFCGYRAG